jgi:hypothetical protein
MATACAMAWEGKRKAAEATNSAAAGSILRFCITENHMVSLLNFGQTGSSLHHLRVNLV